MAGYEAEVRLHAPAEPPHGPVFPGDDAFTGNFVRLAGPAAEGAFVTVELPPSLQNPAFADVMAGLPDPVRIDEGYATYCAIAAYVLISA